MTTRPFGLLLLVLLAVGCSGCLHAQLRHNTVSQAETLTEIYERQVLNNLAMFADNPHALPHFAIANLGTLNVTDNSQLSIPAFNEFRKTFGLEASRQMSDAWQLDPIRDPKRLKLMRCAYQRAVGMPDNACIDCCQNEKEWHGKPDRVIHVYDRDSKSAVPDPDTGKPYQLLAPDGTPVIDENGHLTPAGNDIVDDHGNVRSAQFDCEGPCAVMSGWYCCGTFKDVPKSCRATAGCHHGTYVWVLPKNRDYLTRLTLSILDYAINDPPKPETKEVIRYLDANGDPATVAEHAQQVTVTVPADANTDVARSLADLDSEISHLLTEKNNLIVFLKKLSGVREIETRIASETDPNKIGTLRSEKERLANNIATLREALTLHEDEAALKERLSLVGRQVESLRRAKSRVRQNLKPAPIRASLPSPIGTRLLLDSLAPTTSPALRP